MIYNTPDSQYVLEAAFSPDGCWLASRRGTNPTELLLVRPNGIYGRLLDVRSLVPKLRGHSGTLAQAMLFSPDVQ